MTNKNTVPGDKSAITPGGMRLGSPALTTRGLNEEDFKNVVKFLDRGVQIALDMKAKCPGRKLGDFKEFVDSSDNSDLVQLKGEVEEFARKFSLIGVD